MAFPVSPANGATYTTGGKTYVYNSTKGAWAVSNAGSSTVPTLINTGGGQTINGTLTTTGNIGIGSSPSYLIDVSNSSTAVDFYAGRILSTANVSGTSTTHLRIEKGSGYGGTVGGYITQGVGSGLVLSTLNGGSLSNAMWINNSGNVGIGAATPGAKLDVNGSIKIASGIAFPASQSASADANTLDDYEEGTWTATINSNNGTGTFTVKNGYYLKIGRLVTINFVIDSGNSLAAGTTQFLSGLPFPVFSSYANNVVVGQMGTNGPTLRTQQLMALTANRNVLYIYVGGSQETTTITFASGTATYLTDN